MKNVVLLVVAFALVSLVIADDVLVLTDDNFDKTVNSKDLILVEFYAPWCGHCKRLAPEYAKAATELQMANPPVPIAKIDCTTNQKTCEFQAVNGYPTLKVFRNGQSKPYKGPRTSAGIVKHMLSLVGPASVEITSVEEAERYVANPSGEGVTKPVVFGFFKTRDSDLERFLQVAEDWRGKVTFVHTAVEAVLRHYRVRHTFAIYRSWDEVKKWPEDQAITVIAMKEFVARHAMAPGVEFTDENNDIFMHRKTPMLTIFVKLDWKTNEKTLNYLTKRLKKLSALHGDVAFTLSSSEKQQQLVQRLGYTPDEIQRNVAVAMMDLNRDLRWKFEGKSFSVDEVDRFIKAVTSGEVQPYVKSEAAPTENPTPGDGGVVTVTANTFKSIVQDPTKDVLLEMYAPWCGHCKKLEPIYADLAKEYKGVKDLVIAKMDATANDQPHGFTVTGFPTIFWIPKGNKETPSTYGGERTVDAFKEFIKKNRK